MKSIKEQVNHALSEDLKNGSKLIGYQFPRNDKLNKVEFVINKINKKCEEVTVYHTLESENNYKETYAECKKEYPEYFI